MFEKKERELLSKYKNSAVIFKYEMFDAWDKHLLTIDIHNNGTVNIELIDRSLHYQMKEYEIMNLSEMISTKSSVFLNDSFYIEDINIYDGYRYKILLFSGKDYYYFNIDNITHYDVNYPNAYKLLLFLKDIFSFLKSAGIYFRIKDSHGVFSPSLFPDDE